MSKPDFYENRLTKEDLREMVKREVKKRRSTLAEVTELTNLWISLWQSFETLGPKKMRIRTEVMLAHKEEFDRIIRAHGGYAGEAKP